MSHSPLSKAPLGAFDSPETNGAARAPETTDPYAGTWLEGYSADMRREILDALEADRNPQEDADRVAAVGEATPEPTHFPFGIDTYPRHLQDEIRASLHLDTVDELDSGDGRGVSYPTLPTAAELAADETENLRRLKSYLANGSRREAMEAA